MDESSGVRKYLNMENGGVPIVLFEEEGVEVAIAACENTIAGSLITKNPIYKGSLQSALNKSWCNPTGFRGE